VKPGVDLAQALMAEPETHKGQGVLGGEFFQRVHGLPASSFTHYKHKTWRECCQKSRAFQLGTVEIGASLFTPRALVRDGLIGQR
jgi:hypothetical protein